MSKPAIRAFYEGGSVTSHVRTPEQRYADALGSKTGTCARCLFYHHGESECHRHAPAPALGGMMHGVVAPDLGGDWVDVWWPRVDFADWCGDFRKGDAGTFDGVLGRAPE